MSQHCLQLRPRVTIPSQATNQHSNPKQNSSLVTFCRQDKSNGKGTTQPRLDKSQWTDTTLDRSQKAEKVIL